MPKRPKDQKHDVFTAAARYANSSDDDGKNKAAQWLGQRGGKARAKALSPERRREIAKKAAKTRWGGA
jgi:general stress protein YciG